MKRFVISIIAATSASILAAQSPGQKIDVSKLGPQVGERVPDFSLRDQNGKPRNLQSIMGSKGAMLVFYRSADW
jgi:hypothetical protein